jgi:hypothetical protein
MLLQEGDKVKKKQDGTVYDVRKVHDKGFVILSSEDRSRTAMVNVKDLDLYFTLVGGNPLEGRSSV